MIIFTLILGIALSIATFLFGYTCGKIKGAKDGIDYCFDHQNTETIYSAKS